MSDIENLEDIVDQAPPDRSHLNPDRVKGGFKSGGYFKFTANGRRSIAEAGGLRLSAYEPSLPKLKFMERKDD